MALDFMAPTSMTDTGMWVWAGLITVISLGASWAVALWWQRWKERGKEQAESP